MIDAIDRKILNIIQEDFPVEEEPFRRIGELVGIGEDEALDRVVRLKESGIIRRMGAVFDPKKLGYVSTLCAARVPDEKVPDFVEVVNACKGVTHNYRRAHEYNIWFTVIASSREEIDSFLREVGEKTGVTDILNMPATRVFKINAAFKV